MKIKDILQPPASNPLLKKNQKIDSREINFQQLLRDVQAKRTEADHKTALSPPVEPIVSMPTVQGVLGTEAVSSLRHQGIKAAENALVVLDRFQQALSDPKVTLKQMEPLVQSLSGEIRGLSDLAKKIPPSDPLKKMLDELGILATVEVEKFYRGDYI